ncbi:hypothetical protein GCM10009430_04650 [Aquimarina litoralis]|uniref:Uncharacterized protein n=1 Tax=Aquimarina litoralis TaxID=584605 RepID=A0ABP3TMX3_9FLAO
MKKLMLLLFLVGAGVTTQAQQDTWAQRAESFTQLYSLATDLNKETDKVTAQGSVVSVVTGKGTISVEQVLDKSKPADLKAYKYNLLTSAGKMIPLDLKNSEEVIEGFHRKLLNVKEQMRQNHDKEVGDILDSLFN